MDGEDVVVALGVDGVVVVVVVVGDVFEDDSEVRSAKSGFDS